MNQALTLFLFLFWSLGYGQDSIDYAVYLIGDSGAPKTETQDPVFEHLQERLDKEGEQSAIIFLGDNVYHNGLPPIGHDEATRQSAEAKLLVQLRAVEDFAGEIYFIPGNHDWNDAKSDGIDYIHAQEEFIEFYLDRGDVMIPDHGCPGPEIKKLGKDVLLIGLDSQWWLHPHTDEQLRAADCPNKNFGEIIDELKAILAEEDDKHIIIALHHPIYSDGSHNGDYPIEDHLFPLRAISSNFYLPLPGLGSLYPFYRSAFGAKQDMPHPLYQRLREQILDALDDHQNVVLASGHEHNQQYFALHGHHFIKSGSGSKESFLPNRTDGVFSTEKQGYAKLEYLRSGDVRLRVFTIEGEVEFERFNQVIIPSRESFGQLNETYAIESDSMTTSASAQYTKKGLHKMLFGELYRDDWATDVTFRSLNLSSEKGGLQPLKVGGGFSSKSIRLRDQQGDQWVLRSVAKGVAKVVPTEFVGSLVEAIFQDQISASQPYAALMVPPLAAAVGVYHTNPELVYLPDQQLLGEYGSQYGDALYLFEERPYKDESEEEDFGYSKKIISYADLLDRLRDNSRHHVRQEQVLRSRILDIFLGDWDRHDDQWRWASFKEKTREGENHYYYEPIPRDRDQVFFKYKGVIPALTKLVTPQTRKFQNFDRDLKNVAYMAYNARHFDRHFLNEMDENDWRIMAEDIQSQLSDDVIRAAVSRLPSEIQDLRGEEYYQTLLERRDRLAEWCAEYYHFLDDYIDIIGTEERESFQVAREEGGLVDVKVIQIKKNGSYDDTLYHRTIIAGATKEIRLYGLEEDDEFLISGSQRSGPVVRVIGGDGRDRIVDHSELRGGRKSLIYYDDVDGNDVTLGDDSSDRRSDRYQDNRWNRYEYEYGSVIGVPFVGYTPDDGLRLNYIHQINQYGFRKRPYGLRHVLRFGYSTARSEVSLGYEMHARQVMGAADFRLQSSFFLPGYVNNFFGLSNEVQFDFRDFDDFNFFRYRQERIRLHPAISWSTPRQISRLDIGPSYEYLNLRSNQGRFITESPFSGLTEADFEARHYVGVEGLYHLRKVDQPNAPTTGIDFQLRPSYRLNIADQQESFAQLAGSLAVYNFLFVPDPWVLAHKVEFGVNWGDFGFPFANYLGQNTGLRSLRNNRLGGRSSFVISNDLRIPLFQLPKGAIPFSFGLIGSFDHGRVWADDEQSDRWHTAYGGGFWISPFDVMPISVSYMAGSDETSQLILGLGFAF